MSHKSTYIDYCESNPVPLGFQPAWLNLMQCDWEVRQHTLEGFEAFWVYHYHRRWGIPMIRNPYFTPYTGFLTKQTTPALAAKQLFIQLFRKLPTRAIIDIDLLPDVLIPEQIHGADIRMRNTRILRLQEEAMLRNNIKDSVMRQIRKGSQQLNIESIHEPEILYALHQQSFRHKGREARIPLSVFTRYIHHNLETESGKLWVAKDQQNQAHAAIWIAWDHDTAYYLGGGRNPALQQSGAMTLLMWHAINHSHRIGKVHFDFEGSDDPGIDRFFSNFGATQVQYPHIDYQPNRYIKWLYRFRNSG